LEVGAQALEIEAETARVWAQLRYLYPDSNPPSGATVTSSTTRIEPEQRK
jgi:hypothetical protein